MNLFPIDNKTAILIIITILFLLITPIILFGLGLGVMIAGFVRNGVIIVLMAIIWLVVLALARDRLS